ncbi:hypothetical protein [Rhizobacter sp. OV335]|uniref:hypothetical protein n=1 Tax=Rhizobacter sp. OV335 TaxID=1500264 RepID=UPI001160E4C3|nr:hypothetical protein [Rhizobacter sp. OV335]
MAFSPDAVSHRTSRDLRRGAAGILISNTDVSPKYRFQPRDESLHAALRDLAAAYPSDVIAISNLIHDAATRNAHRFADAFRLRKD